MVKISEWNKFGVDKPKEEIDVYTKKKFKTVVSSLPHFIRDVQIWLLFSRFIFGTGPIFAEYFTHKIKVLVCLGITWLFVMLCIFVGSKDVWLWLETWISDCINFHINKIWCPNILPVFGKCYIILLVTVFKVDLFFFKFSCAA